jgi:hypothetical protein
LNGGGLEPARCVNPGGAAGARAMMAPLCAASSSWKTGSAKRHRGTALDRRTRSQAGPQPVRAGLKQRTPRPPSQRTQQPAARCGFWRPAAAATEAPAAAPRCRHPPGAARPAPPAAGCAATPIGARRAQCVAGRRQPVLSKLHHPGSMHTQLAGCLEAGEALAGGRGALGGDPEHVEPDGLGQGPAAWAACGVRRSRSQETRWTGGRGSASAALPKQLLRPPRRCPCQAAACPRPQGGVQPLAAR